MSNKLTYLIASLSVFLINMAAWAGSSNGNPGQAEGGGSGAEPEMLALLLFSAIPGVFFARKALKKHPEL
ncbi:hypothetical protein KKF91_09560 [Myxococcota bacterium]|nr:hypothetical protein [Myxococcota bacterium]MBU1430788.1 hypothetical protein [Myxococcota bacterium]MBU1897342.1 hypothetical protein [Myxococcota bacterium]